MLLLSAVHTISDHFYQLNSSISAYTQQYTDFNPMLEKYQGQGLVIAAFPCNQFYLQEPAENHELMNGLTHVRPVNGWVPHQELHIYGKIDVNGDNHHPLYEFVKVTQIFEM